MTHTYNVKMVAHTLGLSPHTLRAWERRYSAITPQRGPTGRRLYSHPEVERLRLLVLLLQRGHHIGAIARLPDTELSQLLETSHALTTAPVAVPANQSSDQKLTASQRHIEFLLKALVNFRISDMAQELEWARLSLGARELVLKILAPLLRTVGQMVDDRRISIAQEHVLSSIVRDQIGQILQVLPNYRRPTLLRQLDGMLLTTPEGELHEFGILLGAILCAYYGLPAHYLGINLPAEALVEAAQALHSKVLILGTTPLSAASGKLHGYIEKIDKALSRDVEIWVGGLGVFEIKDTKFPGRNIRLIASFEEFDEVLHERSRRSDSTH